MTKTPLMFFSEKKAITNSSQQMRILLLIATIPKYFLKFYFNILIFTD